MRSLEAVGFVRPQVRTVAQEWHVDDPMALFEIFMKGTARTRALLEGQTEEQLAAVKASGPRLSAIYTYITYMIRRASKQRNKP